jgi:tRNA(fMet)-specific endonuclease VapC
MILLDTDHLTALKYTAGERSLRLRASLGAVVVEVVGTTVINVEKQMRGWMAAIAKERQPRRQITAYRELARLFDFLHPFQIALLTDAAVDLLDQYGSIQISKSDRKIAAIAIAHDSLLLTANKQDYEQIPRLRFENWMD